MIIVLVEVEVEPGSISQVKDALAKMETETRKEPGCLSYAFSVDLSDESRVRVTERWQTIEDVGKHMATPHMAEFQNAVVSIEPKSVEIKAYEVAREVDLPS